MKSKICILALLLGIASVSLQAQVIYVNHAATGDNSGTSWGNAFIDLQTALAAAVSGQIWVAAGAYKPTSDTNRSISFAMKNNLAIYGGFIGTETMLSQRNWVTHETILSGDIGVQGNNADNSWHVILNFANELTNSAILDGFTISAGNATGDEDVQKIGGGMLNILASPMVVNCTFSNNAAEWGGAMVNYLISSPLVTNCTFTGNSAIIGGGGIYNESSFTLVTNSIFTGNSAEYGGGMANNVSAPTIRGSAFTGNSAEYGGGIYNESASSTAINCSFSGNSAEYGGGINTNNNDHSGGSGSFINCVFSNNTASDKGGAIFYNDGNGAGPVYTNSSFFGNTAANQGNLFHYIKDGSGTAPEFRNSIIMNPASGSFITGSGATIDHLAFRYTLTNQASLGAHVLNESNILNSNAVFTDGPGGNLRLLSCSPAINVGLNSFNVSENFDLDGNPRIFGAVIDLGAYEFQDVPIPACCSNGNILYVNAAATGDNNGSSWSNAFTGLQDALTSVCQGTTEIWVAAGTYKPTTGNDRGITFVMKNNLAIYGGFNGTETMRSQRHVAANTTILSGDIGVPGDFADNSYHVIANIFSNSTALTNTAILDGFTITGGYANGTGLHVRGGGMHNYFASPLVINCVFSGNGAAYGGGMYNELSEPELINCIFSGNLAGLGSGICLQLGFGHLINCTFSGNSANEGLGVITGLGESSVTMTNCIVWGNSSSLYNTSGNITYTIIEGGGFGGTGNLDIDPLFIDQPPIGLGTSGNLRLQSCSPIINAGLNTANNEVLDLDGNPRIFGSIIDMGAYEAQDASGGPCCLTGNILYVNAAAAGDNNGSSWGNAFTNLQDALLSACTAITEVWVAAGMYKPTTGTTRSISFVMKNNLAIYGGFAGTETLRSQRNWVTNATILSGDIGLPGSNADNSYHVIFNNDNGLNHTAILDGFTITGGNANGPSPYGSGGGMFNISSSPTVAHCIFTSNSASWGGGLGNLSTSSAMITNCSFSDNLATDTGGGMHNQSSSPIVVNCAFTGNVAGTCGGGMFNFSSSSPTVTNCIFSGNTAIWGGGFYNTGASAIVTNCIFSGNLAHNEGGASFNNFSLSLPVFTNCTFSGNSSPLGGVMSNLNGASPTVINSILWGNSSGIYGGGSNVSHSIVQGGYAGTGNLDINPLFMDQPPVGLGIGGDLRPHPCSPAINTGLDSANNEEYDLNGNVRIFDEFIDRGVYELQALPGVGAVLYVDGGATGIGTGTSWLHAATRLQDALDKACSGSEIWVAAGAYKPIDGNDRSISFELINGVALYGGFAGNETERNERDWIEHVAILSGDIDGDGILNDGNSYNVVKGSGTDATARLDGFTITGGRANGPVPLVNNVGGGMYSSNGSPVVANCIFTGNHAAGEGGAISVWNNSNPVFSNCVFTGNSAISHGGGLYTNNSTSTLTGCVFTGNTSDQWGGGMLVVGGTSTLDYCSFLDNFAAVNAGGFFQFANSSTLTGCDFTDNTTAGFCGGLYSYNNSMATLTDCHFTGNSAANWGGAMLINHSMVTLTGCDFTGNSAMNGGGLYTHDNSTSTLINCSFTGNTASGQGSAIYNSQNSTVECIGVGVIEN